MAGWFDELESVPEQVSPQVQPGGWFDELENIPDQPVIEEEQSIFREIADVPLKIGAGAVMGVRMLADAFGASNPVSDAIGGVENYLDSLLSAQSKQDSAEVARIMQEAEDKGVWGQVKAGLKAVSIAPIDFAASAAGTALPIIAGTILAGVAAVPVGLGLGAFMGAGVVKNAIYESVYNEMLKQGVSEELAESAADEAQSYTGENLDQIGLGTVLGAWAARSGIEPALARMVSKRAVESVVKKGIGKRVLTTAAVEAVPESFQGAQEQAARNIALQREGVDVPTMRGVVSQGTLEGAAAALLGGSVGAVNIRSPSQPAPIDDVDLDGLVESLLEPAIEQAVPETEPADLNKQFFDAVDEARERFKESALQPEPEPVARPEPEPVTKVEPEVDKAPVATVPEEKKPSIPKAKAWKKTNLEVVEYEDGKFWVRDRPNSRANWNAWEKRKNVSTDGASGLTPLLAKSKSGNIKIHGNFYNIQEADISAPAPKGPLDLLDEIRLKGGLNKSAFEGEGAVDSAGIAEHNKAQPGRPLFKDEGGMTLATLREFMQDGGYLPELTEGGVESVMDNDALIIITNAIAGERIVSLDKSQAESDFQIAEHAIEEADNASIEAEFGNLDGMEPAFLGEANQFYEEAYKEYENEFTPKSETADPAEGQGRREGRETTAPKVDADGQRGLVEPATGEETTKAAVDDADKRRNRLGEDEVPVAEGEGELFAGNVPGVRPTQNTIFTDEKTDAARDRLKKKAGTLRTGLDPEMLKDAAIIAGYHVERGIRTFAEFSKIMISELGDIIKPYLGDLFATATKDSQPPAPTATKKAVAVSKPSDKKEYTSAQLVALEKAGIGRGKKTLVESVQDHLREKWDQAVQIKGDPDSRRQSIIDRFHGLRAAEKNIGGIPFEKSPYVAARMSTGLPSIMEAVMLYGAPEMRNGTLSIKYNTVGLIDAFMPVKGQIDDLMGWMAGRRAKLLKSQGRENNFTDEDIDALLSLNKGNEEGFKKAANIYTEMKTAVLDLGEFTGIIDPEARAAFDHAEYIPFYRKDGDDSLAPRTKKGLEGQASGIRRLKGGEAELNDPLSNIVQNFTKLIDASLQNRAALLAVDELGSQFFKKVGLDVKPVLIPLGQVKKHLSDNGMSKEAMDTLPKEALTGIQRMLSLTAPTEDGVIRIMRDGKPEFYRVLDKGVLRAITAMQHAPRGSFMKMMIWFRHLLTAGATTTPEFQVANLIRDTGSTMLFTDANPATHLFSVAKGLIQTLRRDKTTQELMMAGSAFIGGHYYDGDPSVVARHIRRQLRAKGLHGKSFEDFIKTIAGTPAAIWNAWQHISSAVENANRRALFEASVKSEKSILQAAYEAKDILDFSKHGDSEFLRFFTDSVPFLNARMQGIYKLGIVTAENPGRLAVRGAHMATLTVALTLWNLKHYKDEYEELQEWEKNTYWHIAPGTKYHTRIPKPFEFGVFFGTVPERMITNAAKLDTNRESLDALMQVTMDNLGLNPIPQMLRPITEQIANKNFFTGRPIESLRDKNRLPKNRAEFYTSSTMKALSPMLGGQVSPKRLEALWRGYTAGMGNYILRTTDWMVREAQGENQRPEWSIRDYPGIGRFVRGAQPAINTASITKFYDYFDIAEQYEDQIKTNIIEGKGNENKDILDEWGWLVGNIVKSKQARAGISLTGTRAFRKMQRLMSRHKKAIEIVFNGRLPPKEKRIKIDELTGRRNKIVKHFVAEIDKRKSPQNQEN